MVTIRRGTFETNSSSTHSYSIDRDTKSWEELRKGCPLREIPSKYAEKDFTPIKDERYDNGYKDGYNAFIDELLKGDKK